MTILVFIITLIILVMVHELGHFLVAKRSGIWVKEFGFGFPPKLFGKKYGETEYTVNALPFGGFVSLHGEDPKELQNASPEEKKRSFSHAPRLAQALTLFAGPAMNILFAWILFSVCFMVGMPTLLDAGKHAPDERLIVASVLTESPASQVLKENDTIHAVRRGGEVLVASDGEALLPEQVSAFVQKGAEGEVLELDTVRRGMPHTVSLVPRAGVSKEHPELLVAGFSMARVGTEQHSFFSAWWAGMVRTYDMTQEITVGLVQFIKDAFMGSADFSKVAGPVGIAGVAGDAASLGFSWFLSFAALLSINLGILNLLPFPALDGGRLVCVGIESVIRRPLPIKALSWVNGAGFLVLLVLMLVITARDIMRLW
jgi:regulator of sigma E protease